MNAFEFEGAPITDFLARIPAVTVECPEPYSRGTVLKLNLEVRVKSVRLEENREGDLIRTHVFSVEDVQVKEVVTPAELANQLVSGSAAGHAQIVEGPLVEIEGKVLIDPVTGEVVEALDVDSASVEGLDPALEA